MTFSDLREGAPGGGSPLHPAWFQQLYRVTEIVGGAGPLQAEGELRCGTMEMDPGLVYPAHRHPSPELYVVLDGTLRWDAEGEPVRVVGAGTVVLHRPWQTHSMQTLETPARLLWVWWAPGGDTSVLLVPASTIEAWTGPPRQGTGRASRCPS